MLNDLDALLAEGLLGVTVLILLVLRFIPRLNRLHAAWFALPLLAGALFLAADQWASPGASRLVCSGLLIHDPLTLFVRLLLLLLAGLTILLTLVTGGVRQEDSAVFCTLILGATLGLELMAASAHLLMLVVALELASLPCYALVAFRTADRAASAAALPYALYGAAALGVMIYGISLLAGYHGTGSLPHLARAVGATLHASGGLPGIVLIGLLFLLVGLAVKLATVPFHFWCPDACVGASAEVAGFLCVATRAASLAVLTRLAFLFAGLDPLVQDIPVETSRQVVAWILPLLAILASLTCTLAHLVALRQFDARRLLAYLTIAQGGFLMMGIAVLTPAGLAAVLTYLVAFAVVTFGAFAVLAVLHKRIGSSDLRDLRGLIRRAPVLTVLFAVFVLGLFGLPPLVGFVGRFGLLAAIYDSRLIHAGQTFWINGLLIVAALNLVLSAATYLGVLRVLILEQRAEDLESDEPVAIREPLAGVIFTGTLAILVVGLGLWADPVIAVSQKATARYQAPQAERNP